MQLTGEREIAAIHRDLCLFYFEACLCQYYGDQSLADVHASNVARFPTQVSCQSEFHIATIVDSSPQTKICLVYARSSDIDVCHIRKTLGNLIHFQS